MSFPRKFSAINDDSAEGRSVAAHEFGKGMHYNIRAVIDRTLPLATARKAHELIEDRAQFGKVVLVIDSLSQ